MDREIIATCGCVCDLRASWNWVDESFCDVEINIRIPCKYHSKTEDTPDLPKAAVNYCNPVHGVHASWCTGHEGE